MGCGNLTKTLTASFHWWFVKRKYQFPNVIAVQRNEEKWFKIFHNLCHTKCTTYCTCFPQYILFSLSIPLIWLTQYKWYCAVFISPLRYPPRSSSLHWWQNKNGDGKTICLRVNPLFHFCTKFILCISFWHILFAIYFCACLMWILCLLMMMLTNESTWKSPLLVIWSYLQFLAFLSLVLGLHSLRF